MMRKTNRLWGAPRIHGELLKLGIQLSQATVTKYMVRRPKPPSQTWRAFLENHTKEIVSIDFFTVPTITFRILYVFLVLAHDRRKVLHFNVTAHPTSEWVSQQLVQAFPWDTAPRYLVRDRDTIYGECMRGQLKDMGVKEVLTAPRSPWQSPYVGRLIGSIRRECLDHIVVISEPRSAGHYAPISLTITEAAFTSHRIKTHQSHAQYTLQNLALWSRSRRSTGTHFRHVSSFSPTPRLLEDKAC